MSSVNAAEWCPSHRCTCFACTTLDGTADLWNLFADDPGYGDAPQEVRRIRQLQRENDLRKAEY